MLTAEAQPRATVLGSCALGPGHSSSPFLPFQTVALSKCFPPSACLGERPASVTSSGRCCESPHRTACACLHQGALLLLLGTTSSQEVGAAATQVSSTLSCGLVSSHFWLGLHHTLGQSKCVKGKHHKSAPETLGSAQGWLNGLLCGERSWRCWACC